MKNHYKIGLCIIIGFAVLGVIVSAVLFFLNIPNDMINIVSLWAGIIGTVSSVILSVAALIYSNKSSNQAEESLKKITEHYNNFCKELTTKHIQDSLGENSVNNIIDKNTKK